MAYFAIPAVCAWIGTAVVNAAGFGSGGVAVGSGAAEIQAWFGNVGAGSVFAAFQSAGATGAGSPVSGIGAEIAAAGGKVSFNIFGRWRAAREAARKAAEAERFRHQLLQLLAFLVYVAVLVILVVYKRRQRRRRADAERHQD